MPGAFGQGCWGAWHGAALCVHRMWSAGDGVARGRRLPTWRAVALTQSVVAFGWIFFRAPDTATAWQTVRAVTGQVAEGAGFDARWWILIVGFGLWHAVASRREGLGLWRRLPPPVFAVAYGAAIAVAVLFVQVDVQPFLYFQF